MNKNSSILILGSSGLVGSSLTESLKQKGYGKILEHDSSKCDLLNEKETIEYIGTYRPDYVFFCAALVGGIQYNIDHPVEFYHKNTTMGMNVLKACHLANVTKLMNVGSTCIYPRECPQPMKEEYLLSGPVEPTNEAYALAKIGILKLCEYYNSQYGCKFISVMPSNIYGINDSFNPAHSHVLSATIRKVVEAKTNRDETVLVWGTGKARREFVHSDDVSDAMIHLMKTHEPQEGHINIGTGEEVSITELTKIVMKLIDYEVPIVYDRNKPDGMPVKVSDITKLKKSGYTPKISLTEGIMEIYEHYRKLDFKWNER